MDGRGHQPEGRDVGRRLLRPRVPGAVHLVGEADHRRHTAVRPAATSAARSAIAASVIDAKPAFGSSVMSAMPWTAATWP